MIKTALIIIVSLTLGYVLRARMEAAVGTLGCGPEDCHKHCPGWNQCDVKWSD